MEDEEWLFIHSQGYFFLLLQLDVVGREEADFAPALASPPSLVDLFEKNFPKNLLSAKTWSSNTINPIHWQNKSYLGVLSLKNPIISNNFDSSTP